MGVSVVPVDLTNPGQVFACLGFAEAADVLLGQAEGGFDWQHSDRVRFQLEASGDEAPVARVLRFLDEAAVIAHSRRQVRTNDTGKWDVETVKF